MIIEDLYSRVLIDPIKDGANELFAISGYASATFANRHLASENNFKLNLIIGMPSKRIDHSGYLNLYEEFGERFNGFYIEERPPVHCKVYGWFNSMESCVGFSGSANYSQPGFFENYQLNQLTEEKSDSIKSLYKKLLPKCISIKDFEFGDLNSIISSTERLKIKSSVDPGKIFWEIPNIRVRISFLSKKGILPIKSGINWGQRKGRNPDEAYLSIKVDATKKGFLPERNETFTLLTDDNYTMDCKVVSDGRKGINSTNNNSLLGIYFRNRMGIPLGNLVEIKDLEKYGRTDFTIEKINDETFLLDFSV